MTASLPQVSSNGTRLVRFLSELAVCDAPASPRSFADRLGQLIDLSDSISLSVTHLQLFSLPFEETSISAEAVRKDFMEVRATLLSSILRSFTPAGNPGKLKLPQLEVSDELVDYGPYLRFYNAHQRDMEFRVRNLQDRVRIAVSGLSPRLARLVELETAIDQTLIKKHRQSFAALPGLLEQRFKHLASSTDEAEQLIARYQRDLRGLLLAEADARLLPVLGLVEAIDEENEDTPL
jgi:hypothetical protein